MCITNSMLVWWTLDSVPLPPVAYTENFHGGLSFSGRWW